MAASRVLDPRLLPKIQENINDSGSLVRQIIRGSKSNELLSQATKNFASSENTIEASEANIKKMGILVSHLQFQAEAIERSVGEMETLQDQLTTLQR
ncbi:BLOC-1-related complex subunit 7-like [Ptychodera flava]|uniref:BLOC-1-related complex subunit 7-like n=1 Tax=Ptychodera flava TaxID=63121 RepID=UPI00396AAE84